MSRPPLLTPTQSEAARAFVPTTSSATPGHLGGSLGARFASFFNTAGSPPDEPPHEHEAAPPAAPGGRAWSFPWARKAQPTAPAACPPAAPGAPPASPPLRDTLPLVGARAPAPRSPRRRESDEPREGSPSVIVTITEYLRRK